MKTLWIGAVLTALLLAAVGAGVGIFLGTTRAVEVVLALTVLLGLHHLHQLHKLMAWLKGSLDTPVPEGAGIWDKVFAGLHRRVRIRVEQQQALSNALERFRRAGEALPDGVVILSQHRQIEGMNTKAAAFLGLNLRSDVGQTITNLLRQPDFVAYLDGGQFGEPLILRNVRADGVCLQIQVVPYAGERQLLLVRDVTQLERLETMRRDFVANVSHELKTPLTVVAGFIETLQDLHDSLSPEQVEHYLSLAHDQSIRMQHLIADLLTLSALETSGSSAETELVEVAPLLEAVRADSLALSSGRHEVTLEMDGPARILGVASELRSAFGNLASNAVRYTPEGGRISLRWQRRPDGAAFVVADTGIGIPPQHIPRLTERFYRVDRGRSRESGGTGLGLAIVKHVLTRHQGWLEVESEPGKGSTFTAHFPATRFPSALDETARAVA